MMWAAEFLGIAFQKPFLEAQLEVVNGSLKEYPSNGLNFASAGSGLLTATNHELVSYAQASSLWLLILLPLSTYSCLRSINL